MPTTLGQGILPALDAIRSIGGALGLRPFTVTIRVRTWLGGTRVGLGQKQDVDTVLTNLTGANAQPVMVRYLTTREALASGGMYKDRDLRVGPITPTYAATPVLPTGGLDRANLDPPPVTAPVEILYIVKSPDLPAAGVIHDKVSEERTALHWYLTLRSTGRQA